MKNAVAWSLWSPTFAYIIIGYDRNEDFLVLSITFDVSNSANE